MDRADLEPRQVFDVIRRAPQHTYQVLTKQLLQRRTWDAVPSIVVNPFNNRGF